MSQMRFPSLVSDVMNEIISIDGTSPISEAAKKMIERKLGSILVTIDGEISGIVTRSDMISRVILSQIEPDTCMIKSIMSSPLISIDSNTPILDAMRYLRDRDINQLLVKDESGYVGIVSEGDLVRAVTLCSLTQFTTLLP
jgi:signal-transduction protein with cAMP-binding, CBS, and nucleotidyltransferase domain